MVGNGDPVNDHFLEDPTCEEEWRVLSGVGSALTWCTTDSEGSGWGKFLKEMAM